MYARLPPLNKIISRRRSAFGPGEKLWWGAVPTIQNTHNEKWSYATYLSVWEVGLKEG